MTAGASYVHVAGDNVVVLRWPEQRDEAQRLDEALVPTLFLVEPGAAPPLIGALQDWVRLPADDADVGARLESLRHRAVQHPARPVLDGYGQFEFRGRRAFLSPTDDRVATALVASFGEGVSEAELISAIHPDGMKSGQLRVHVSRLRKRLEPLGLQITAIRNFGYRLHESVQRQARVS
jgi:hypothetical protein